MNTSIRPTGLRSPVKSHAVLAAAAMAALGMAALPASAANKAWSTAPTSNAFSGTNWTASNVPGPAATTVVSGDTLFFGASTLVFLNNDLAAGTQFAGITFLAGAPSYTIAGNAFTLTGNLVNNSTARQVFLNTITLNQNTTFTVNNTPAFLNGVSTNSTQINGSINGGTFSLIKNGAGQLDLNSPNSYSGGTTISGILQANVNGALGTGGVTVNTGAGNMLALGAGLTVSNPITINGGGIAGQGTIFANSATGGVTNITGPVNVTGALSAGGVFATSNSTNVLNIVGDNTITSTIPVTVRNGLVKFLGAQNYTTGTVLNGNGGALQFAKVVSMPATGAITFTGSTASSIIVNAGGAGEFTDGSGTTTAGTIGGILGGVGGQGAPIVYTAGQTVGIDTTNATAPVTYSSPWMTSASNGLLKLGPGTLNLTAGGTYTGAGAGGFPLIVREGNLNLSGGTHAATGEIVVGGNYGTVAGDPGRNATLQVDGGSFTVSTWMSVGRGNGTGGVTSTLNLNNTTATSALFSGGFNGGSALNLPKFAVNLNNSTYTVTGANFNLAESPGSNGTLTLTGASTLDLTNAASIVHFGQSGNATVTINDTSKIQSANNNATFYIGRMAGGTTRFTLNGSAQFIHNGNASGTLIGDGGVGVIDIASPTASVNVRNLVPGHFGTGVGVVLNRGTMLGLGADGIFMGDGDGSSSYVRNDNAAAAVANDNAANIVVGISPNSYAVLDQVSGTLSGTRIGSGFYRAAGNNANGQINVSGGTLAAGATGYSVGDAVGLTGNKYGEINVTGGTFSSVGPIDLGLVATGAASNGTQGVITMNGGVVEADTITATNAAASAVLNGGGGTLRASAAGTNPSLVTANIDRIQLNAGGLTVDTNGTTKSIDTVIADPANQGVTGISFATTADPAVTTGTGFVGRPFVKITDSTGTGATAVANWNPATGEVTGVTITSPGSNYTNPAVVIYGGGGTPLTAAANLFFSAGGNFTKSGTGTLTLTGANTYTGNTVVTAGTLRATPAAYGNTILGSGTGGLDLQGTGRVVLDYTGGTDPVAQVKSILAAGYAGNFASGQIRGTARAAGTTIGYGETGNSTVTIRVTLPGDANLDGAVGFDDFVLLQGNFSQSNVTFAQGDFDYNNVVNFNDFVLLQGSFGQSLPGGRAAFTREQYAAVMSITDASQVPEPAMLSVLGLGAAGLLRRRRAC